MDQFVKILIVDDKKENLLAMNKLLRSLDAEVYQADSGEEALSLVLSHRFAVILMDVQMPNMDGFECASLLHGNNQTKMIPIIFVTAISKEQFYQQKGYESGAVDYLTKPIVPEILLSKVNVFLRLDKSRIELEYLTQQIQRVNQKNKLLLDNVNEGIIGLDILGNITFINPTGCALIGEKEQELLGLHISQFFNSSFEWKSSKIYSVCLEQGGVLHESRDIQTISGLTFPSEINVAAITDEKQKVVGAVLVLQDVTERKKLENKLIKMAKYDSLTGLANRLLFKEVLHMSLARSERRNKNTGIMYIDLDQFKEINDTLGHDAGDALLILVAKSIKSCVRPGDLVARLGGDEFAIILDDVANPQDAQLVAEKILQELIKPKNLNGKIRHISASIGIASSYYSGKEPEMLVKVADKAMYKAKHSGKNCFFFWKEEIH